MVGIAIATLLLLVVGLLFFIRSPWGQDIIVQKAVSFLSKKTGTEIRIERLFITFQGDLYLEGLYVEDLNQDTLIYSQKLETGIGLKSLLQEGTISVSKLEWEGVKASVRRDSLKQEFNFDFILSTFVSDPPKEEVVAKELSPFPTIEIGPVDLKGFDLTYEDQVLGIDAHAIWDQIQIQVELLDLNKMNFDIEQLFISDSKIDYFQYKPFESKEEKEPSDIPLPLVVLDRLQLDRGDWQYSSVPDGLHASAQWENLSLSLPEGNLEDQKILLKNLELREGDFSLELRDPDSEALAEKKKDSEKGKEEVSFSLPDWWIEVGNVDFENTKIAFTQSDGKIRKGQFNPEAIFLDNFNFSAHSIFLKEKKSGFEIDRLAFKEGSGLILEEFKSQLVLNEKSLKIKDLRAVTGSSELSFDLGLVFSDLDNFIRNPGKTFVDLNLKGLKTDAKEALFFVPELSEDKYFQQLVANGISAMGKVRGDINQLQIPEFLLTYGDNSSITVSSAVLNNFMDLEALGYDILNIELQTKSHVVKPFIGDIDYDLPEDLCLLLTTKGGIRDAFANLSISTSDGDIFFNGNLDSNDIYRLESAISLEKLDLGKILKIPELAPLTFVSQISGHGTGLYDLEGMISFDFEELTWNENDLSALELQLTAKDTMAELKMEFAQEYLDFLLEAGASLDSLNPGMSFNLAIDKIQSLDMGLTQKDISGKININGSLGGSLDSLTAKLSILDSYLFHEKKTYPIGDFIVNALIADTQTNLDINSDFLTGSFKANTSLGKLTNSLKNYLEEIYTGESGLIENFDFQAKSNLWFHPTPFIDKLLVEGMEEMDTLYFEFDYDSGEKNFATKLDLKKIQYNGALLDSFFVEIHGDANSMWSETAFKKLKSGPIEMPETHLRADFKEKSLEFEFLSLDDEGVIIDVFNQINFSSDTIYYHVQSEGLIFNRESWKVPSDNLLTYWPGYLGFKDFMFSKNGQTINFTNSLEKINEEHIGAIMSNFELNTLLGFLNPYDPLFTGNANGELVVVNPFEAIGIIADLSIEEIELIDIPLGNLDLKADATSLRDYEFLLSLKEGISELDLAGKIHIDSMNSNLDLKLDLHALKVELLEMLAEGEIKEAKGIISGSIDVTGTVQSPQYQGELNFSEASFKLSQLGNVLNFPNETIKINNSGLSFNDFSIVDESGQVFTINGKVITEDFADIGFDLKLFAENFQLLNSTRADNDLFFGKALVDLDLRIQGNFELPVIDARVKVNRGTDLTLILPEDQLNYMERTGIVLFVNHEDPYDILYQRDSEIVAKGVKGYDITANLQVDPQTVINFIVDERTNDNLRAQGQADLNLTMDPNGDITLSGRYEVRSGHYELNLFGLVNRRFLFAEGSTILWTGDVLDANLNITTIYNVRTSPAELMQAQLSGTTTDTRSQFRQILPFMVYLKINGELLQPEISFELDMPEESRGSFEGNVYSMIQQVNQRDDELNKQVFSLLVLNQFFPMMGNDGSSGGSVNLAKSSANQILSSQLNTFSDRIFGETGFSLDFDLDTYTDYQTGSAEDRTQLNVAAKQKLMDDRLIISVGGQVDVDGGSQQAQQGNTVFGDVSLEYLLDERGRWRVTTFRKNQFESVIDGQLIITGISFIFNKEFNSFVELLKRAEEEKSKEKKKKGKNEKQDCDVLPKEQDEAKLEDEIEKLD
ncbi:translocation/assembly module TamB domain-containing protein [Shivajiella indica]|uniref:Translocation/assembly module TamB domain-containing protein n=1 Tax=Shivajiella indica TaxID=872115 RepID=A0ABW5B3G0_9BACT